MNRGFNLLQVFFVSNVSIGPQNNEEWAMHSRDPGIAAQLPKEISESRRPVDDIQECCGAQKWPLHQLLRSPVSNVLLCFGYPFRRWNSGVGTNVA